MKKYQEVKSKLDSIQDLVLELIETLEMFGKQDQVADTYKELLDEINEKLNEGLEM
jgi:gas vesicle protein